MDFPNHKAVYYPFKSLFLNNPDLCYLLNKQGQFVDLNDVTVQTLGGTKEQILHQSYLSVIHPSDKERIQQVFMDVLQGSRVPFETTIINFRKKEIPLSVTAMPFIENGKITGVIGVAKDMTEAKLYEKKLVESKKRYKDLIYSAPYPIIVSFNQQFVVVNDAASTVLEAKDCQDLFEKNIYDFLLYYCNSKGKKIPINNFDDLKPFYGKQAELTIKTLTGRLIDLEFSFNEIEWENQKAYMSIFQDITKRKQMELERKNDLALAHQVQNSVLPCPIEQENMRIHSYYSPSAELSGDMYYWSQINDHLYGVIILDIMGHGISSSLLTMSIRSLLPPIIHRNLSPSSVMERLNDHMRQLFNRTRYFMTGIYCLIDTNDRVVSYLNAGHPSGLLQQPGREVVELTSGGIPIGMINRFSYLEETLSYEPGSRLILYTDGVFESLRTRPSIGLEYMKRVMKKGEAKSAQDLLQELEETCKENPQTDDIAVIVIDLE